MQGPKANFQSISKPHMQWMTVYTQFDLLLNALMDCKMYKFLNICTFTLNTIRFKRTLNVMSTEPLRSFKLNEIVFLLYLVKPGSYFSLFHSSSYIYLYLFV